MVGYYDTRIIFQMHGKQFDDGYNLHSLLLGLDNFQKVLDKSYLTIKKKGRMTEKDREIFQIKAYKFTEGSFITEFGILLLTATQITLPYASALTPKDILNLVFQGFDYIMFVLKAYLMGKTVEINAGENNMLTVNIVGDSNIMMFPPEILDYVKRAESNFESLAQIVNPEKGIDSISFYDKNSDKKIVKIGKEEKELFKSKTKLETEVVSLKGELYRIDGKEFKGKLIVTYCEDDQISVGEEYNFEFINKEDVDKLKSAFMAEKTIYALKETILDTTTLKRSVKRLLIIDVA
ncbi:MAG: hypothetical protein H0Z35_09135 [Thermoanaerobacteraceae bacterium]|nr:hypothetical protein [Thermoanaerobacteraceae bacterium]